MARAYRWPMESARIKRIAIALLAAYAVALHALLVSFVPVSVAAFSDIGGVLCSGAPVDRGDQPDRHDVPCPSVCAAFGHGLAGPAPAADATAAPRVQAILANSFPRDWIAPHVTTAGPQAPRGPPLV